MLFPQRNTTQKSTNQWNDKSNVIYSYYGMLFGNKKDLSTLSTQQVVVQSFSYIQLFVTPWTAAYQASLSITNSWSLPKLMSIELVMPSNQLNLHRPILLLPSTFPVSGSFQMSQLFASGGQSTGVSASARVLPMNIQDWFPSGWTGWISLRSKGLSRVFSNSTDQKHQFSCAQLSL